MNQTIIAALLVVTLGIASGFPLKVCDKLRDVKEGADNYDLYLVKLNDSSNYKDAEYVINIVKQYQTTLDQYASKVHEPSVRSRLELTENAGVLHGTLSQQALLLVRTRLCWHCINTSSLLDIHLILSCRCAWIAEWNSFCQIIQGALFSLKVLVKGRTIYTLQIVLNLFSKNHTTIIVPIIPLPSSPRPPWTLCTMSSLR